MNILITGASSGLGLALKQHFENSGHTVISVARTVEGEHCYKCDISNKEEVVKTFVEIGKEFNKIDIIINNAGYGLAGVTELLPSAEIEKIFGVNFFGALNIIQSALPLMQKGGKIINISSACALFALPFRSMYCASKSATSMLSDCLRMELKSAGIQVTAICPGNIHTNFSKNRVKFGETNDKYGDIIAKSTQKIDKEEHNRMSLASASKKIFNIINKKRLKPQYIIGGKYKLLYFVSRLVPKSWILSATNKVSK